MLKYGSLKKEERPIALALTKLHRVPDINKHPTYVNKQQ